MAKSPSRRGSGSGARAARAQGGGRAKHASRDVEAALDALAEARLQALGQRQRARAEKWLRKMKAAVLGKVSGAASHAFDASGERALRGRAGE